MKTGDTVLFKKDGLFGKGIVLDESCEEYDRYVVVTEVFETGKHCAAGVGDTWGINEEDLGNDYRIMWRKPTQGFVDGSYIMTRIDDDGHCLVNIKGGYLASVPMNDASDKETPIKDFDSECRFFGPIPDVDV